MTGLMTLGHPWFLELRQWHIHHDWFNDTWTSISVCLTTAACSLLLVLRQWHTHHNPLLLVQRQWHVRCYSFYGNDISIMMGLTTVKHPSLLVLRQQLVRYCWSYDSSSSHCCWSYVRMIATCPLLLILRQ